MSQEARVIKATFTEWRMVKTRKVLQLVLEVPLEQTNDVLMRLGAPMPDQEKWVAVALLDELVAAETEHQRSKPDPEMERARKRSIMLAKNPKFINWASNRHIGVRDEETAAQFIRNWCEVDTRGEIATNRIAYVNFLELELECAGALGRIAESRG